MNSEPLDPITLSALQHWCYCRRQCALIHIEQVFEDNLYTQRGQALHKRVDDPGFEVRDGLRVERALPFLFSDKIGVAGTADAIEFLTDGMPYPVAEKHGSLFAHRLIASTHGRENTMPAIPTVKAVLETTPYRVSFTDDLGHAWSADEPADVGGGNSATTAERLILAGLGACTAITLKMVAARRQIPLSGVQVELQLNPGGKPESGNDIVRKVSLQGDLSDEQLAQLLKVANACPMHKLLTGEIRIQTELGA